MISTTKIFCYSMNVWIILVRRDRSIQKKIRHQISPLRNLVSFFWERGKYKGKEINALGCRTSGAVVGYSEP
jgi:hypothetical protein